MILLDRGLSLSQMQSVIGISENLIAQYQALYNELNEPQYQRVLDRLKQAAFHPSMSDRNDKEQADDAQAADEKGGG
jgi:hypothetical protein